MSVGYKNPPKDTRFKKGTSGYPGGRPKRKQPPVNPAVMFRRVAKEEVKIDVEGTKITMTYWEAYLRQISSMALNKNTSAMRLLDQLRRQFPGDLPPGDPLCFIISEDDAGLL